MARSHRPTFSALIGFVLFATGSVVARAAEGDALAAEVLFEEARALVRDGKHDAACPKFAESMQLDPAAGTALNLAECYMHVGKTASAWLAYRDAAALARRDRQREREEFARARATALAPTLCRLTLNVPTDVGALDGFALKRGGADVPRSTWSTAVPVDPGRYRIEASARGHAPSVGEVVVKATDGEGACEAVAYDVPPLVLLPAMPDDPAGPAVERGGFRAVHGLAVGLAGVGIVALGASGVFAIDATNKNARGEAGCTPSCTPEAKAQIDDAGRSADIATVLAIGGGIAVAGAIVTWVLAPTLKTGAANGTSRSSPATRVSVRGSALRIVF
jgi:hypothetical protein